MTILCSWHYCVHYNLVCIKILCSWHPCVHDKLVCMTNLCAWQLCVHNNLVCMTILSAWQSCVHDILVCMTILCAWRSCVNDNLVCLAWLQALSNRKLFINLIRLGKKHRRRSQQIIKLARHNWIIDWKVVIRCLCWKFAALLLTLSALLLPLVVAADGSQAVTSGRAGEESCPPLCLLSSRGNFWWNCSKYFSGFHCWSRFNYSIFSTVSREKCDQWKTWPVQNVIFSKYCKYRTRLQYIQWKCAICHLWPVK